MANGDPTQPTVIRVGIDADSQKIREAYKKIEKEFKSLNKINQQNLSVQKELGKHLKTHDTVLQGLNQKERSRLSLIRKTNQESLRGLQKQKSALLSILDSQEKLAEAKKKGLNIEEELQRVDRSIAHRRLVAERTTGVRGMAARALPGRIRERYQAGEISGARGAGEMMKMVGQAVAASAIPIVAAVGYAISSRIQRSFETGRQLEEAQIPLISMGAGRDVYGDRATGRMRQLGFGTVDMLQAQSALMRETGVANTGTVEGIFERQRGMGISSQEQMQFMGMMRRSGVTGFERGGRGSQMFEEAIAGGMVLGLSKAQLPEYLRSVASIQNQLVNVASDLVDPSSVAAMVTAVGNRMGGIFRQPERAASVISAMNQAILAPGGGESGRGLVLRALGMGTTRTYYEAERLRQEGLNSPEVLKAFVSYARQTGGGQKEQFASLMNTLTQGRMTFRQAEKIFAGGSIDMGATAGQMRMGAAAPREDVAKEIDRLQGFTRTRSSIMESEINTSLQLARDFNKIARNMSTGAEAVGRAIRPMVGVLGDISDIAPGINKFVKRAQETSYGKAFEETAKPYFIDLAKSVMSGTTSTVLPDISGIPTDLSGKFKPRNTDEAVSALLGNLQGESFMTALSGILLAGVAKLGSTETNPMHVRVVNSPKQKTPVTQPNQSKNTVGLGGTPTIGDKD